MYIEEHTISISIFVMIEERHGDIPEPRILI